MSKLTTLDNSNSEIMTVHEVAKYLKLSEATVYRWAKDERIPRHRIGRLWRFKKEEIDEWVRQQKIVTNYALKNE